MEKRKLENAIFRLALTFFIVRFIARMHSIVNIHSVEREMFKAQQKKLRELKFNVRTDRNSSSTASLTSLLSIEIAVEYLIVLIQSSRPPPLFFLLLWRWYENKVHMLHYNINWGKREREQGEMMMKNCCVEKKCAFMARAWAEWECLQCNNSSTSLSIFFLSQWTRWASAQARRL